VKHFDTPEVLLRGLDEAVGQDRDAVFSRRFVTSPPTSVLRFVVVR